jgi:hypothetical protein
METSEIKINIVEASSELANIKLFDYYRQNNSSISIDEIEDLVLVLNEDEIVTYTEHAQDQFNILYDLYYDLLENLAIK